MPPRAVLLDFDGVIADTENHHVAAWQRTLGRLGWEVPDEVCARAMEVDDRRFLTDLLESKGLEGDVEGWVRRKQALTRDMLANAPRVYPGFAELVRRLAGRVTLAVVTTTWRENVLAVLESAGLRRHFDLIIGKEDVVATKPDPAGYRRAVESLSLRPDQAIALEDSPDGVAAARSAGVPVVAIGHRRPRGPWVGEAPYLERLVPIEPVLEALGLGAS